MTYMEITKIEQWQMLSRLVHSSLIVHCSYMLWSFWCFFNWRKTPFQLPSQLSWSYSINVMTYSYTTHRHPLKKEVQKTVKLFLGLFCYPAGNHKVVPTAAILGHYSLPVSRLLECPTGQKCIWALSGLSLANYFWRRQQILNSGQILSSLVHSMH